MLLCVHVVVKTLNWEIDRLRQRIVLKCVLHVQHDYFSSFNPFPSKGFPIDQQNRLALDGVKSISALSAHSAVKGLANRIIVFWRRRCCCLRPSSDSLFFSQRTAKKCIKMQNARAGPTERYAQKSLFLLIKYARFWRSSWRRRHHYLTSLASQSV